MQQYTETAQRLEKQGACQDAAFVYLKLLNKPKEAAAVLERGRLFAEAAAIYLHHAKDREKAALCYEKAGMTETAVALYKELQQYEKAGDMYASMGQKDMANTWYNEAVNEQLRKAGYLQAALIVQHKIGNSELAQHLLLRGWNESVNPTPCLQAYFTNITDEKLLMTSVNEVAEQLSNPARASHFIQVLITQYETRPQLAEPISDVVYAVVAQNVVSEPSLVASLRNFAPTDPELIKDAIRYKTMRGKK
jgi:tetratricopeptide (TPR) repeat protein